MADVLDRLKTALADRYAIEREIGSGGMATVYLDSGEADGFLYYVMPWVEGSSVRDRLNRDDARKVSIQELPIKWLPDLSDLYSFPVRRHEESR